MKLIASMLHLDRHAVQALRVRDMYSLHRVVYGLYEDVRDAADKVAGKNSGILFADQGGDARGRRVLLLADRSPGRETGGHPVELASRPISSDFLAHVNYRFRVIVNPTRRDNASRKLMPVKGREAIAAWFAERAPGSWGFVTDPRHLQVDRVEVLRFTDKHRRPVTLAQAHVHGVLQVRDSERFVHSFAHGIGRGRAFGCGLLQIVPLATP